MTNKYNSLNNTIITVAVVLAVSFLANSYVQMNYSTVNQMMNANLLYLRGEINQTQLESQAALIHSIYESSLKSLIALSIGLAGLFGFYTWVIYSYNPNNKKKR